MFPTWSDWDITYTPKGLAKRRVKKTLQTLAVVGAIIGITSLRKRGLGRDGVKALLQGYVRSALFTGAGILQTMGQKV
jgi:hypothetical protein